MCSGIIGALGRIPELQIPRNIQRTLAFDLLAAYYIGFCIVQKLQESISAAARQAVYIPGYDFHICTSSRTSILIENIINGGGHIGKAFLSLPLFCAVLSHPICQKVTESPSASGQLFIPTVQRTTSTKLPPIQRMRGSRALWGNPVLFVYFAIFSMNRIRIAATCARVALPVGISLPASP